MAGLRKELEEFEKADDRDAALHEARPVTRGPSELRGEYERLYAEFLSIGPGVVQSFVDTNDEVVLRAFCEVNEIVPDAQALSKGRMAVNIARGLAERRGRTKRT